MTTKHAPAQGTSRMSMATLCGKASLGQPYRDRHEVVEDPQNVNCARCLERLGCTCAGTEASLMTCALHGPDAEPVEATCQWRGEPHAYEPDPHVVGASRLACAAGGLHAFDPTGERWAAHLAVAVEAADRVDGLRNAGPWVHVEDGSPCPSYVAHTAMAPGGQHWWCTEHQGYVRTTEPEPDGYRPPYGRTTMVVENRCRNMRQHVQDQMDERKARGWGAVVALPTCSDCYSAVSTEVAVPLMAASRRVVEGEG